MVTTKVYRLDVPAEIGHKGNPQDISDLKVKRSAAMVGARATAGTLRILLGDADGQDVECDGWIWNAGRLGQEADNENGFTHACVVRIAAGSGESILLTGELDTAGGAGDLVNGGQVGPVTVGTTDATAVTVSQNGAPVLTSDGDTMLSGSTVQVEASGTFLINVRGTTGYQDNGNSVAVGHASGGTTNISSEQGTYIRASDGYVEIQTVTPGLTKIGAPSDPSALFIEAVRGVSVNKQSQAHPSAVLDIVSTSRGVLLPRMTTTQRDAIASPGEGLEIYNLTLHKKQFFNGTTWETVTST